MAEGYDTKIRIGMEADLAGGVQTEKQYDKLKQKAREFGKETNKSATSAIGAFERMGQSVNKVRGAIMGLGGVTAIVTGIVQAFKNWRSAAREVQENIDSIKVDAANASLEEILKRERDIADAIERGNRARRDAEALEDRRLKIVRDLADANLRVEEAKEKAAVNDGPDKDLQLKLIDEKYAAIRSANSSSRAEEDAKIEYDRKMKEATAAEEAAKSLREAARELRDDAKGWNRSAAADVSRASRISGSWRAWNPLGGWRDDANSLTERSKKKSALAVKANNEADAKEKQAEEAEARAKTLRAEASMTYGAINVARTNRRAEEIKTETSTRDVATQLNKRVKKRDDDRQTYERAVREKDSVDRQIEQAKAQLAVVQDQKAQNGLAMARAGDAYDMAVANGRPAREQRAAFDERQRAIREAQNAGHAFDRVEAELVATIKNLTERQNSLARTLSTFKKQSKADNSEYAGD